MAVYNLSDLRQIATIYSESATYNKGEYCVYQGLFYRCTTAIITAEAWTAEHWTQVTVADELAKKVETASTITDKATGAVATFPDGAAKPAIDVTCQIEPVQDLNGYDHAWPAGGGKNLIAYPYYRTDSRTHNGITYTVNADGSVTANGTATANSFYEFRQRTETINPLMVGPGTYTLSGCPSGGSASTYQLAVNRTQDSGSGSLAIGDDIGAGFTFTLEEQVQLGVYINILAGVTVNNLTFKPMLAAGSEVLPYEPYANVCPISGHEGMTIKRKGKNLFETTLTSQTVTGITYTVNDDGSVAVSGTHTGSTIGTVILGRADVNAGMGIVTISGIENIVNMVWDDVSLYDANDALLVRIMSTSSAASRSINLAAYPTCAYIKASIKRTSNGVTVSGTWKPQIEIGAVKTAFEQYKGDTYNVSWQTEAGTVYGGTLDVTTGLLTIDTWLFEDNGGSGWGVIGNGYRKSALPYRGVSYSTAKERGNWLKPAVANWINEPGTFAVGSYMNINVSNIAEITDVATLQAYLAEHPLQLCYELRDKITHQLTATQVEALLGQNNIWSDTGDTIVEYYADLKAYIDKKIAEIGG